MGLGQEGEILMCDAIFVRNSVPVIDGRSHLAPSVSVRSSRADSVDVLARLPFSPCLH